MKSINASGKTVEDAVKAGLKELGLESSDVTIDVLDVGSPGLFGMFGRLAKVRLTVKEEEDDIKIEMPVLTLGNKGLSVLGETERKAEKKAERKKSEPSRRRSARRARKKSPLANRHGWKPRKRSRERASNRKCLARPRSLRNSPWKAWRPAPRASGNRAANRGPSAPRGLNANRGPSASPGPTPFP